MTRDIKCAEWNTTDQAEAMKMFRDLNKYDKVPGIQVDNNPTSDP